MVIRRLILVAAVAAVAGSVRPPAPVAGPHFYPDDPISAMPPPLPVKDPVKRDIDEFYDFITNSSRTPGERQFHPAFLPGQAINTLGEVPDSDWYTNRWRDRPMNTAMLVRGPDSTPPPFMDAPWNVTSAKTTGVTPGFSITDAHGNRYLVKFDPKENPEMATAADVVGAHFFWAFGYNVPCNYIVVFDRRQLRMDPKARFTTPEGVKRAMRLEDVDHILEKIPKTADGRYRGMATAIIGGRLLGPFRYDGTRKDDPNDIVLHENRRDLRGLYVFAAWLNHTDAKSGNSMDTLVTENGIPRIKHYLIDFGAIMGSDSTEAKDPRAGHEYFIDYKPGLIRALTLGFWIPEWARADWHNLPAVGHFRSDMFDPDHWKNNYPNPAFLNRLPDDEFWAAKQVMRFTPEQIRAMVETGRYSDPEAAAYLTRVLIERQRKIGAAFFAKVLPLDNFAMSNGRLAFDDLGVKYGFFPARNWNVQWFRYDNGAGTRSPLARAGFELPDAAPQGGYMCAEIRGGDAARTVTVYVETAAAGPRIVGVDRTW